MMLSAIGREFSRQLSEYKQFKVNLLFANMGIFFLVTGFLTYFDSQKDTLLPWFCRLPFLLTGSIHLLPFFCPLWLLRPFMV